MIRIVMVTFLAALTAPLLAAPARPVPAIARIVIVSIDGLRPDLLAFDRTPQIHDLMAHGSYTMWARTVSEGYTVPSHVSMLTGVVPSEHGVTWDRHIEDAYPRVPTLFELARTAGYKTAIAVGKTKLIVLTQPGTLDHVYLGNEDHITARDVAEHAVKFIREPRPPDVLFVLFGDVDVVGHKSGWGSREQLEALARVDAAIGTLRRALARAQLASSTLLIVTADHGGAGLLHPPEDARSQFIPWIAAGPGVRQRFDLTRIEGLDVRTTATFATACALLGIPVPYPLDSEPVLQILEAPITTQPLQTK